MNQDPSKTRAGRAGIHTAKSLIEMIHLMYQNNTSKNFYSGLLLELNKEVHRRGYHE